MSNPKPTLAVTVVSSNVGLLSGCLETLFQNSPSNCDFRVYATWNGSGRGRGPLPAEFPVRFPQVTFIDSPTSGFTPNQNQMMQHAKADYYLVINDDLLFRAGSIENAIAFMELPENSRVGQLGIKLLNADGTLQPSTYSFAGIFRAVLAMSGLRRFIPINAGVERLARVIGLGNGKSRYWAHDATVEVDTFRGAYMLVRGVALTQAGLLDPNGGEETEWIMRFHRCGWKVMFYPGAEVVHLGSMTMKEDPRSELNIMRIFLNIYYKHMPRWRYFVLRSAFFVIYLCKYFTATVQRDKRHRDLALLGVKMIWHWPQQVFSWESI